MESLGGAAVLAGAAAAAGAVNAVAGGGTLLSFPALLAAGLDARTANATSTVALWPGSVASAVAYRGELDGSRPFLRAMGWPSLLGGAAGSVLLVVTEERAFRAAVPWLVLFATALFAFSGPVSRRLGTLAPPRGGERAGAGARLFQFAVAVYGGYFGAGIGVLMLAALSLLGLRDIHRMNGMKTVLGAAINGVSVAIFAALGLVRWREALLMAAAAAAGGWIGARLGRRVPPGAVRVLVVVAGLAVAASLLLPARDSGAGPAGR